MPHESAACLGLYRPGPTGSPAGPLDQLPPLRTGVPLQAAAQALRVLCAAPGLAAITLTEVNPSYDPAGHQLVRYVDAVADAIAHGLTSR